MIEMLGGLFGGLFRLAPEVLKFVDRKDERKHELAMVDKNIEADKLKGQQQLAVGEQQITAAEIAALVEGVKVQGAPSGVKWVDAINSLIRPTITFWWVIVLYTAALAAQYVMLLQAGISMAPALAEVFGPTEKGIAVSIIGFWFVDRAIRKANGG